MPSEQKFNNQYSGQFTNMCIQLPCGKQINGTNGNKKSFKKWFELHQRYCTTCVELEKTSFSKVLEDPPAHHFTATRYSTTPISKISSHLNSVTM